MSTGVLWERTGLLIGQQAAAIGTGDFTPMRRLKEYSAIRPFPTRAITAMPTTGRANPVDHTDDFIQGPHRAAAQSEHPLTVDVLQYALTCLQLPFAVVASTNFGWTAYTQGTAQYWASLLAVEQADFSMIGAIARSVTIRIPPATDQGGEPRVIIEWIGQQGDIDGQSEGSITVSAEAVASTKDLTFDLSAGSPKMVSAEIRITNNASYPPHAETTASEFLVGRLMIDGTVTCVLDTDSNTAYDSLVNAYTGATVETMLIKWASGIGTNRTISFTNDQADTGLPVYITTPPTWSEIGGAVASQFGFKVYDNDSTIGFRIEVDSTAAWAWTGA